MVKVDTLEEEYKKGNLLSIVKKAVMIGLVVGTITGIVLSDCFLYRVVLAIMTIGNVALTVLWEVFNNQREDKRIVNAVEVGYGKNINSDVETEGFYNNQYKPGIRKLVLNLCESLYFTYHIYKEEFEKHIFLYIVAIISFIICFVFMNEIITVKIFEVVFGMNVVYDLFKSLYCYIHLKELYNAMDYCIVSGCATTNALLTIAFKYEKIKSYTSIQISHL